MATCKYWRYAPQLHVALSRGMDNPRRLGSAQQGEPRTPDAQLRRVSSGANRTLPASQAATTVLEEKLASASLETAAALEARQVMEEKLAALAQENAWLHGRVKSLQAELEEEAGGGRERRACLQVHLRGAYAALDSGSSGFCAVICLRHVSAFMRFLMACRQVIGCILACPRCFAPASARSLIRAQTLRPDACARREESLRRELAIRTTERDAASSAMKGQLQELRVSTFPLRITPPLPCRCPTRPASRQRSHPWSEWCSLFIVALRLPVPDLRAPRASGCHLHCAAGRPNAAARLGHNCRWVHQQLGPRLLSQRRLTASRRRLRRFRSAPHRGPPAHRASPASASPPPVIPRNSRPVGRGWRLTGLE